MNFRIPSTLQFVKKLNGGNVYKLPKVLDKGTFNLLILEQNKALSDLRDNKGIDFFMTTHHVFEGGAAKVVQSKFGIKIKAADNIKHLAGFANYLKTLYEIIIETLVKTK